MPPVYAKRVDKTQKEIVEALRAAGFSVFISSTVGRGFPDLIAGRDNRTHLIECKAKKGSFTPEQLEFYESWKGASIIVLRSAEEALAFATAQNSPH